MITKWVEIEGKTIEKVEWVNPVIYRERGVDYHGEKVRITFTDQTEVIIGCDDPFQTPILESG